MPGRGRPPHPDILTPAERRVLDEVRAGRTNPEIAERLEVSVNTVRYHVSNMLAKLGLPDRRALAAWRESPDRRRPWAALAAGLIGRAAAAAAVVGAGGIVALVLVAGLRGARHPSATTTPTTTLSPAVVEQASRASDVLPAADGRRLPTFFEYTVRPGDTLDGVATTFHIPAGDVQQSNPAVGSDPTAALTTGVTLRIPAVSGVLYQVRPGDTLASIARAYGVAERDIVAFVANGLSGGAAPEPGSLILIPGGREPR